ncbi:MULTISPECIES: STAS domain-containing protein [unclassified Streptomyces]|uniref:STAS domain-containing protein n=1 Tax=unclassified Streptomyces TaxID=2593676 RepID=UPI002E1A4977
MTIHWRYTVEDNRCILSVAGFLGPDAVRRFTGAVGWALARGTGPVIVDLTELRSWSAEGQAAITDAARRVAEAGRRLELAAIPPEGSVVPTGDSPAIPVHADLAAALAAHGAGSGEPVEGRHEWCTTGWPAGDQTDE